MPRSRQEQPKDVVAFWALTAFAVVMYAVPGEWIPAAQGFRLALVTSSLAAGLMALRRMGRLQPVTFDGARGLSLLALALLTALSVSWSINPAVSRTMAIELLKLVAIYLTIINIVSDSRRLAILCGAMVLASMVTSIGVINWYSAGIDLVEGFRARWVGVYADPNHMAMDLGLIVPIAVAFVACKENRLVFRLACALAAGLAVTAIVLSHSRGGFIGLVFAMVIWAIRERRRLQAVVVGAALALGLVLFAPESFWKRNETVTTFQEDASAMGRVYAWEVAAKMSSDRPLLGVGAAAFRYAWPLYAPPEARRAYVAHNVFLDVIGELGFIGLFFFLIFVGGAAGSAFEASNDAKIGWLGRGIAASIAGYLVCDLFSGYLLSSHFYVLFGIAAAAGRIARERHSAIELPVGGGHRQPLFAPARVTEKP